MLEKVNCYGARVSIFLIVVALVVGMAGCSCFSSRTMGIRTWNDLDAIRKDLGGHYILMNDLDSTTAGYDELASPTANEGKGWHPIGGPGSSGDGPPFAGTFDGQGYEIRDVFINMPGIGYVGLFSVVGEGGVVQNIGMVNANVTATAYIGSLVGLNKGIVSNSYSTGSLTGSSWIGSLVGQNEGTVSNSYSTGSVTSDSGAGGLIGGNTGILGDSYSTVSVTAEEGAGGLMAANSGTVSNCYSLGSVTGNDYVGGLAGYNEGTVNNSFWDIQTSGQSTSAGGLGKTTAEMQNIATFSGAGWNIIAVNSLSERNPSYIWNMVTGVSYPFLSWQP